MNKQSYILGISGGSASGKTTIANIIMSLLGTKKCQLISLDNYYFDISYHKKPAEKINYDSPGSIDIKLFEDHLHKIKLGETVDVPMYDFATHKRLRETIQLEPKSVIIVEGLFLFNQVSNKKLFDAKIYVSAPDDIRLLRRIRRDVNDRGRSVESVLRQYEQSVRPMHLKYIEPNKEFADISIDTYLNSLEDTEYILKKFLSTIYKSDK